MRTHDQTGKDKTQTTHVSECSRNPTRRLAGVPACSEAAMIYEKPKSKSSFKARGLQFPGNK